MDRGNKNSFQKPCPRYRASIYPLVLWTSPPPACPSHQGFENTPCKDKTRTLLPGQITRLDIIGNIVTCDGTFRVSRLIRIQWFVDERNRRLYLDINGGAMGRWQSGCVLLADANQLLLWTWRTRLINGKRFASNEQYSFATNHRFQLSSDYGNIVRRRVMSGRRRDTAPSCREILPSSSTTPLSLSLSLTPLLIKTPPINCPATETFWQLCHE